MAKNTKYIFCFLVVGLLILPSLGFITKLDKYDSCEKKALASFPAFKWNKDFLPKLEAYAKDHVSFKNLFSHLNGSLKYTLFTTTLKPASALEGKEGWFFYSSKSDKVLGSYSRTNLWSPKDLKHKMDGWTLRANKLKASNKEYYVAVWPNKSTIYAEYVPSKMQRLKRDTLSKLDQIMTYPSTDSLMLRPIDVRPKLLEMKKQHQLYYKHDTHWNELGAFYAYQELMKGMGIKPYELTDFTTEQSSTHKGDLVALSSLCNSPLAETNTSLKHANRSVVKVEPEEGLSYYLNDKAGNNRSIIIYRDSYLSAMIPYIMLHFKKGYFPSGYYNEQQVKALNPDLVVTAVVERYL